jgi:hypothetical protein
LNDLWFERWQFYEMVVELYALGWQEETDDERDIDGYIENNGKKCGHNFHRGVPPLGSSVTAANHNAKCDPT